MARTGGKGVDDYHAIPGNWMRMKQFLDEVKKLWLHQLRDQLSLELDPFRSHVPPLLA